MLSFPVRAHGSTPALDHASWSLESGLTAVSELAVPLLNCLLLPREPWPTRSREDKFLPQAGNDSQPHYRLRTRSQLTIPDWRLLLRVFEAPLPLRSAAGQTGRSKSRRRLSVVKRI